jgi:hypothetical protein
MTRLLEACAVCVGLTAIVIAAALALLTPAMPACAAETDPIASLLRNAPPAAIYDLENADLQSMVIDAVFVTILNIHSVPASPPPAKYDRPYQGKIEIVEDVTEPDGTPFEDGELIGWAEPDFRNQRCTLHVPPLWHSYVGPDEIWVVDPISREKIIRHELGHCNGGKHPKGGTHDQWVDVESARWCVLLTMPDVPEAKRDETNSFLGCNTILKGCEWTRQNARKYGLKAVGPCFRKEDSGSRAPRSVNS